MRKTLSERDHARLRELGFLRLEEVAYFEGDLLIAEHTITREMRILPNTGIMLESRRTVLLD